MMYGYKEQLEIVDKIPVKEGQGYNMNCPFCGGRKTFGIALRNGKSSGTVLKSVAVFGAPKKWE